MGTDLTMLPLMIKFKKGTDLVFLFSYKTYETLQ